MATEDKKKPRATMQGLAVLRIKVGISQSKLASLASVDRGTISKIEKGRAISAQKVESVFSALNKTYYNESLVFKIEVKIDPDDETDDPGPRIWSR
jgi:transcriptional regulator with XRE-family HTH domain